MLRAARRLANKKEELSTLISELRIYKTVPYYSNNGTKFIIVRSYSKEICPPKQEKSRRGGVFYALGAIALVGGATLGYAKYDPEFRKTLVEYLPFTDGLIKIIFQEKFDDSENPFHDIYTKIMNSVADFKKVNEQNPAKKEKIAGPEQYKAPPPVLPSLKEDVKKPTESYKEIRLEKKEKGQSEPSVEIVGEVKPKSNELSETDARRVAELEEQICEAAEEAVNAYNNAVYVLKRYNQDIEFIIDEAIDNTKPEVWDDVKRKTKSKVECVNRASEKADVATKKINRLKELISRPDFQASPAARDMVINNINKVQDDINNAKKDLEMEQKIGGVTEKYWDKVHLARQHFSEELESLFPDIDLSKKHLHITPEELDLFVLHAYGHVLFYQKELAKMETVLQKKLDAAVEAARKGGSEPLTQAQICEALEQEKRRLTICFQQQCLVLKKEMEDEMREQLKRQSQTFTDHLNDAIKTREMEIERELARRFDEQLEAERCRFKIQLAAMVGRLKGLDYAIKVKADADASSKQGQILWSACQALLRSLMAGCPGLSWKDQVRPLEPEITAVKKAAAPNDELVQAVLNGIPKEARDRGIYPEDALRERFLKVERVARTVALVPEDGAALPVHILSYLQSLLLVKAASPIPQSELNDEKVDFSKLNTNDILQRARYWLDRGDFAQCLKYMNLLKGAPRCVARQWMNETRILLETQQAANTLMAHAASSGLTYL